MNANVSMGGELSTNSHGVAELPLGSRQLDPEAVETLYVKYRPWVMRRARQLLRNAADVQDACQDVFLIVLTKGGDFRGDSSWMTWLYRVTTNVCLNRLRRLRRMEYSNSQRDMKNQLSGGQDRTDLTAERLSFFRAWILADAITQRILVYHFVDDLPQEQVGALVGLSRVAVNIRIQKFRKRLADLDGAVHVLSPKAPFEPLTAQPLAA